MTASRWFLVLILVLSTATAQKDGKKPVAVPEKPVPASPQDLEVYKAFITQMPYATLCPDCEMHKKYLFRELTPGSGSNCIEGVHFIEPPSRELRYIPKGAMKGLGVDVIGLNRLVKLLKQSNNDQKPGIHFELSEVTFDQDRTIAALHYKGLGFSRGVAVFSRTADSWQLDQTRTLSCTALPNRYVNAVQLTQEQIDVYRGFLSHYRCSEAPGCDKEDQLLLDMAWGFPPNPKSDDRASHCLAGIELQPSTGSHTCIMGPEVVRGLGFSLVRTEPLRDSRNVQ